MTVRLQNLCAKKKITQNLQKRIEGEQTSLQIGDLVQITNNYKGLQGTIGNVIKAHCSFATIETDNGYQIVRALKNLSKLKVEDYKIEFY